MNLGSVVSKISELCLAVSLDKHYKYIHEILELGMGKDVALLLS